MRLGLGTLILRSESKNVIHYGSGFGYWIKCLDFAPYFKSAKIDKSTGEKYLYIRDQKARKYVVAALNSSLFYYFYTNYGDSHNLTQFTIENFPIIISSEQQLGIFDKLKDLLMTDLKKESISRSCELQSHWKNRI